MKYMFISKQINIRSKLTLMHVQYTLKANIVMSLKQLGLKETSRHVYIFITKKEVWITGKVRSVKYWPSPTPSRGLQILLMQKFNCSKSPTFLNVKQIVNKMYDYEFTGEVKIEENEDRGEIWLCMKIKIVKWKNWRKNWRCF